MCHADACVDVHFSSQIPKLHISPTKRPEPAPPRKKSAVFGVHTRGAELVATLTPLMKYSEVDASDATAKDFQTFRYDTDGVEHTPPLSAQRIELPAFGRIKW